MWGGADSLSPSVRTGTAPSKREPKRDPLARKRRDGGIASLSEGGVIRRSPARRMTEGVCGTKERIATPVTRSLVRNDSFGTLARDDARPPLPKGGCRSSQTGAGGYGLRSSSSIPRSCSQARATGPLTRGGHWRATQAPPLRGGAGVGADRLLTRRSPLRGGRRRAMPGAAGEALRVGGRGKPLPYGGGRDADARRERSP
jgi:hypothetical protein